MVFAGKEGSQTDVPLSNTTKLFPIPVFAVHDTPQKTNKPPLLAPVLKRRQSAAGCPKFSGKEMLEKRSSPLLLNQKSIGQSCSAAVTSSLEDFTAVCGRHSLSEAMDFLSVQFLRLVSSFHGAYASF